MTSPRREIIEAGAGCGKTRGLVFRYIEGLGIDAETGQVLKKAPAFHPREITALTFTEDAAREMRSRVLKRLEELELHSLRQSVLQESRISTFHSLCLRLLRPQLEKLGYPAHGDLMPEAIATEGRMRHALAQLAQDPQRNFLLTHLNLGDISELSSKLWFSTPDSSSRIREQLQSAVQSVEKFRLDTLQEVQTALLAESGLKGDSWLECFRDALLHPSTANADLIHFGRGPRKLAQQYTSLVEAAKAWRLFIEKGLHGSIRSDALDLEARISEALNGFFSALRESGPKLLDYAALEFELHRLLKSASPDDSRLMPAPKLLLVDEFQDTNRVQYEILQGLSAPHTEWYFVGDPKQSIYKFRGAEAGLFGALKQELQQKELSTNYRSSSSLLEFMNQAQVGLFSSSRPLDPPAQFLHCGSEGLMREALLTGKERPATPPVRVREKARGESVVTELIEDYRARCRELGLTSTHAALFTSWKSLYATASELESAGIPVRISGHEPYLDHHLTHVFAAVLDWIDNPTLLKGPTAWNQWRRHSLPERLELPTQESIQEFMTAFGSHARGQSWSTIFNNFVAILRPSRWRRGSEWTAAMERLLIRLESLQVSLTFSLSDLGRFLVRNAPALEVDVPGVVPPPTESNILQLYTVHGSKGLEFDAIYMPELIERKRRNSASSIESNDDSTAFRIQIRDPIANEDHPALRFAFQDNALTRENEAESRRLLYVAFTRAKKTLNLYLHTPSNSPGTPDPAPLLGWPAATESLWNRILLDLRQQGVFQTLEQGGFLEWNVAPVTLKVAPAAPTPTAEKFWLLPEAMPAPQPHRAFYREGVSSYIERQIPTPTFFKRITSAKSQAKKNELSADSEAPQLPLQFDAPVSASSWGELVHGVLEFWNGDLETLPNWLPEDSTREKVQNACLSLRRLPELSDLWTALKCGDPGLRREFGLYVHSDEYRLSGYADLIWERGEELVILDWKTSSKLSSLKREERLKKIRFQLKLYAQSFAGRYKQIRGLAVGLELSENPKASIILDEVL